MEQLETLSIGLRLPKHYDLKRLEGGALLFSQNEQIMIACMPEITAFESQLAQTCKIKIGLLVHEDAIFIITKLGDVFEFDFNFNWDVGPVEGRGLPPIKYHMGYAFPFVLYDSVDKHIKVLRYFTVTPSFSSELFFQMSEQKRKFEEGTYDFKKSYASAMKKYPTIPLMWKDCIKIEEAGIKFKDDK